MLSHYTDWEAEALERLAQVLQPLVGEEPGFPPGFLDAKVAVL